MAQNSSISVFPDESVHSIAATAPIYLRETMWADPVLRLFLQCGVTWAPVVDDTGAPIGSVFLEDLTDAVAFEGHARVGHLMRPAVAVVAESALLSEAASLWLQTDWQPLAVIDSDGIMTGTLSPEDLDCAVTSLQPRPRVLVADDECELREALGDLLIDEGYDVTLADNGEAALLAIRSGTPDIVLLDLMMPVMSGWEVLRVMESRDTDVNTIPMIVISAFPAPALAHATRTVRACFSKPIDLERLLQTLRTCCGNIRPRRSTGRES